MRAALAASLLVAILVPACGSNRDATAASSAVIATAAGDVVFHVEVADTESERERGLMERTRLPDDAGMAFLFDGATTASFWMKDTLLPLSIAFWDADGRIVGLLDMQPCTTVQCPTYNPGVPYVGALEVNLGAFASNGVAVGDVLRLEGEAGSA